MRTNVRVLTALVAGGVLIAGSGVSYADTVNVGQDVTKAPGTTGSFVVSLIADSTDGVNGCNATPGQKVRITFSSSDAAVVAAPASVDVEGCDDPGTADRIEDGVTVNYSVAAGAADDATATLTASASAGKNRPSTTVSGNFTGDSFVVTVDRPAPANTAPVVTVTGVEEGGQYEIGTPLDIGCTVVDAEDAEEGALPVITGTLTNGIGAQTATCEYTDSGSPALSDSDAVSYEIVDTGKPTSSAQATAGTAPYTSDTWTKETVTVELAGQDGGSGVKEIRYTTDGSAPTAMSTLYASPLSFSTDTATTIKYIAIDNANNVQTTASSFAVKVDKTAPDVAPGNVNDTTWRNTDLTENFTASDTGSGLAPNQGLSATDGFTLTASNESASATATTNDSKTVSDAVGNTTTRTLSARIDRTAPSVSYTRASGTAGTNDWYKSPVTATFTGTDALSGPASATQTVTSKVDGPAVSLSSPAFTDTAGNTRLAGAASQSFKIDTVAPVVSDDQRISTWSNAASVTSELFTASDATSGIADDDKSFTLKVSAESTKDSAGVVPTSATRAVTDAAGHTSTATFSALIDRENPTVAFTGGPADGATYWTTGVPAAPTCAGSDALSGLAATDGCVITGYSAAAGKHTVTATATDKAGNTASTSRTYTVRDLTHAGFYHPVDMNGVYNTVKGGSTVPLKFNLAINGVNQTDTALVSKFTTTLINCDNSAKADEVEIVTTGSTALRYDATAPGQFIQNWKTPTGAGDCYRATATLVDGDTITALFKLK